MIITVNTEFIHFGYEKFNPSIINFRPQSALYMEKCVHKPIGLWASPRTNTENKNIYTSDWSEWCDENDFNTGSLNKGFTFTLKGNAKILVINKPEDILPYVKETCEGLNMFNLCEIDFERIYNEFDGMYVAFSENYIKFHMSIFNGYDVDSLCIWNADVIENVNNFSKIKK